MSNTPTMIMMSLLRRTCGPKMSMATQGDTHHLATTDTMAVLAAILPPHVIQMSLGPQDPLRGTPKTHLCAMIPQEDLHLQEDVLTQDPVGTTLPTTPATHLGIIMASVPPDRATHTGLHVASPRVQWTCRGSHQVHTNVESLVKHD